MFKKLKNKLIQAAIVTGGAITTVTDTYTVTTTRDGQQHVVQTGRGR